MSLPFDDIENLRRSMERLEEHKRKVLLSPSALILETVNRHEALLASSLPSLAEPFIQAANAALKREAMQSQIPGSVVGAVPSYLAFASDRKQWEKSISDSVLRITSSPLALITNDMQRAVDQLTNKLAAESDLSKLYSTILKMNPANTLSDLLGAIENERFEKLDIQSDGSIMVDGDAITSGDMQQAISELLDEPGDYLRNLGERLAALGKPLRLVIVWLLKNAVLPLLFLLYQDYDSENKFRELQKLIRQEAGDNRRDFRAAIKELADAPPKLSSQWRVIIRPVKVRSHPANRVSIDSLPINTVARFVEKRGEWVLIQYESPGSEITMTGWVSSKYLKRFE